MFSETISGHKRGKKTKKVRLLWNIDIILKPNLTHECQIMLSFRIELCKT